MWGLSESKLPTSPCTIRASLGRVGVCIRQGHKIRWKGGRAIHSYAMLWLGPSAARDIQKRDTGRDARETGEKLHAHMGNNPSAPLYFLGKTLVGVLWLFKLLAWPPARACV